MANLARREDIFDDLFDFRRTFDHIFNHTDYLHREFSYERFERTIALPEGVDTEKIAAEYNNGVLEITARVSATALPKRIEIKSLPKTKGASAQ